MNAIEVRDVHKTYRIPHERHTTLTERLLSLFRPVPVDVLSALNGITLDVTAGTFVGIIGANGSGKSTLLKIMAGVLLPDRGQVQVNGTLSPLLELGLGFHNWLTVRENVVLYGAVLGYPRQEMARRVDDVITFAGLERFRDAKLKSLSSGMLVRLAFATALRADADILLLDEVLAVGDAEFQHKCLDVFSRLQRERKTIVLVSHDVNSIQRFCEKAYWLDKGRLAMAGDAGDVIEAYLGSFGEETPALNPPAQRRGDGQVRYVHAALEDEDGAVITRVPSGSRVVLRLVAEVHASCKDPVFGFNLQDATGHGLYATNTAWLGARTGAFAPGEFVDIRMPFTAALRNGAYTIQVGVSDQSRTAFHDLIDDCVTFAVEESPYWLGTTDLRAAFHSETRKSVQLGGAPTRLDLNRRNP